MTLPTWPASWSATLAKVSPGPYLGRVHGLSCLKGALQCPDRSALRGIGLLRLQIWFAWLRHSLCMAIVSTLFAFLEVCHVFVMLWGPTRAPSGH